MDALAQTRRSLHAVGELVIAGPQYRAYGTIKLRAAPGGFGGVAVALRVEGTDLVWDGGRTALTGTYRALAAAAGLEVGAPEGVYGETTGVDPDDELAIDAGVTAELADWFSRGDAGLRAFAPTVEPVLWPEHFDLALTVDEVNYGISPGDAGHAGPYAYVGPWSPREGPFWNAPFGAVRAASDLTDAASVAAFFSDGRSHL